jgi:hypothetical protein
MKIQNNLNPLTDRKFPGAIFLCIFDTMENKGFIEIRISGKKGLLNLAPDNFDISEIRDIIEQAENLLFPSDKRNRPLISYEIKDGSVRHIFKTSMQAVIGFSALIAQIKNSNSIDFLEHPTAKAMHVLQETAIRQNYQFDISTSVNNSLSLIIDNQTTYFLLEKEWVEAEFYFYGDITDMGGKVRANVHVSAPGIGSVVIETPKEILTDYNRNPLYKPLGVRATGKQNTITGEVDKTSLRFKEFVEYNPVYDEKYLDDLIAKASKTWEDVKDPDAWLREMRGGRY